MALEIVSVVDEGLGHAAHLVAIEGELLMIDPLRIVDRYVDVAERRGWRVRWTADTHTHADYVSGSPELAKRGAIFFASRDAQLETPHCALDGGDEVALDGLTLRALATPGHTPDHLAYLLLDRDQPVAVFTGGSLMVGTVGRPDLLGADRADVFARALWRSLHQQLLVLPDELPVYPTHGAGSFCSAPAASAPSTTIGREKAMNPLLQLDEDEFVARLLGSLGSLPAYFSWLPERNRVGFGPPPTLPLTQLSVSAVRQLVDGGAELIDVRSPTAFAQRHLPGSLSDMLRPGFATWLGAIVLPERPLVFITDDATDRAELVRQCADIGYDRIAGELVGGIDAWSDAGEPTASLPLIAAEMLDGPVLDVRLDREYRAGHVPGASHVELTELPRVADQFGGPITVMCGHGGRAATAASIIARKSDGVRIVIGGPDDWSKATGRPLELGT